MASPPFDSKTSPWRELTVPGVELYLEREPVRPHRARGAARVAGQDATLHGKEAFDAARARAGDDPVALATLAMLFLDDGVAGKRPWLQLDGPQVPEQQAIAKPPARSGDTLVYWRFHAELADLVRCTATLSTGQVTCQLGGDVVQAQRVAQDPAAAATQYLASENVHERIRGIQALGQARTDAARAKLIELALDAFDQRERQAAVEVLGQTGGAGGAAVVAALGRVLLHDRYAEVRQAAATALGALRDPAGRDALTRAASGDANGRVQVLADEALKQLK